MGDFAVFIAVGPGQQEVDRTRDLLESLHSYEPGVPWIVLVDDALDDRHLTRQFTFPPTCQTISLPNPRRGKGHGLWGGLCTANLTAYAWLRKHTDVPFIVKLDTDALVIGPFARRIAEAFAAHPEVGMLGMHHTTCAGQPRSPNIWPRVIRKLHAPFSLWRQPVNIRRHLMVAWWGRARRVRQHIHMALANGYEWGEHCLGGSYALSMEVLRRMDQHGCLDDLLLWRDVICGEDVMMGMYARAMAMRSADFVRTGEVFGIQHVGLPAAPLVLAQAGYSIIHSIKNDPTFSEEEIRTFFRQRRNQKPSP